MAGSHIDWCKEEEEEEDDRHMKKYLNVGGEWKRTHGLGGDPDPYLGSRL